MTNISLTVNDRAVTVPEGWTLLQAAAEVKADVPTLCHGDGLERFTSCMVCVVEDLRTGRLLPACSAPAEEGMRIETGSPEALASRKAALEFLLSEHVGDCRAPCQRACPAHMDIPVMIRRIESGRFEEAFATVMRDIALPAVLGRICPAPCEKACKRSAADEPVSVCLLKRFVSDADLTGDHPFKPRIESPTGRSAAVVGAGPAGLAAAYYLSLEGHACHVYDLNTLPGGRLRYGVSEEVLPRDVLDAEIGRILDTGVRIDSGKVLGRDMSLEELRRDYQAVVLTPGTLDPGSLGDVEIQRTNRGLKIDRNTFQTSIPGVFSGGNAVGESRLAIRALAHGKEIALAVDGYLREGIPAEKWSRFDSLMGKPRTEEIVEYLKEAAASPRLVPAGGTPVGFSAPEAAGEASRCFGCDCRKPDSCRLRRLSEEYAADQKRFSFGERRDFRRIIQHDRVVYEPGKCIKCGLCVRITARSQEKYGLAFLNRGYEAEVAVPFNEPLSRGLTETAAACVRACPTAALAWRARTESENE